MTIDPIVFLLNMYLNVSIQLAIGYDKLLILEISVIVQFPLVDGSMRNDLLACPGHNTVTHLVRW